MEKLKRLMQLYNQDYFFHGKTSAWNKGYNEETMRGVHTQLYNWIKRFFPKAKRKLILGCALGIQVKISLEHDEYAVGVDWTPLLGRHKLCSNLVRASVTHLPFKDQAFQLAVNVNLLEHIPEEWLMQVLAEEKRVAQQHFIEIAHRPLSLEKQPAPPSKPGDITHVTMRPHNFWKEKLKLIGDAEYHEKLNEPPWNIYIIR